MTKHLFPYLISVIKSLMAEAGISEAELARKTNVPQATINRILLGITKDPRISTMLAISDIFDISINQLIGKEPINKHLTKNLRYKNSRSFIPIIDWHEIIDFVSTHEIDTYVHSDWILVDKEHTNGCFALKSTPSMEPKFRQGSTIIVEPCNHLKDHQVVIISFNNNEPTVRRIKKDGAEIFIQKLNPTCKDIPTAIKPSDKIIGVITETRIAENII